MVTALRNSEKRMFSRSKGWISKARKYGIWEIKAKERSVIMYFRGFFVLSIPNTTRYANMGKESLPII